MKDVTFDQLEPKDQTVRNNALHCHYEELEECFGSLVSP